METITRLKEWLRHFFGWLGEDRSAQDQIRQAVLAHWPDPERPPARNRRELAAIIARTGGNRGS